MAHSSPAYLSGFNSTPAVEKACGVLPVIVFDRGVTTKYPVTFIHPVGGYGFGIQAGEFVAANAEPGAKVLMLRQAYLQGEGT